MNKIDAVLDERVLGNLPLARTVGIDIGSRASKGVLLFDGLMYTCIMASGVSSRQTQHDVLDNLLCQAGKKEKDIDAMAVTGYGRVVTDIETIPFRDVTEISCHGLGAHLLNPSTRTILDIGGQDSKVIKIDPSSGKVIEFAMNDKCAAGTGRFLEKVALLLEVDLDELGTLSTKSTHPIEISSQCVVFAESEIISLIAQGFSKRDIAAGAHFAVVRRVRNLLRRIGIEETLLFTGGVSNNVGVRQALEAELKTTLGCTPIDAAYAGALGAAAYANQGV